MNKLLFMTVLFSSTVVFATDSGMSSPEKPTMFKIAPLITAEIIIENASKDHVTKYKKGIPFNYFETLCSSGLVNRKIHETTALHEAVKAGKEKNVRILLLYGANPNVTDGEQNTSSKTPLHLALAANREDIADILIENCASREFSKLFAPLVQQQASPVKHSLK